jgi:hypothetical protein
MFKTVLKYGYCAGVGVSSLIGIRDANIQMENNKIKYKNIGCDYDINDYAMRSFFGGLTGAFSGLWFPITLIGRLSVINYKPKENDK